MIEITATLFNIIIAIGWITGNNLIGDADKKTKQIMNWVSEVYGTAQIKHAAKGSKLGVAFNKMSASQAKNVAITMTNMDSRAKIADAQQAATKRVKKDQDDTKMVIVTGFAIAAYICFLLSMNWYALLAIMGIGTSLFFPATPMVALTTVAAFLCKGPTMTITYVLDLLCRAVDIEDTIIPYRAISSLIVMIVCTF